GLGDLELLALLHAARHEAECAPVAQPEVVRARRAAADAHAEAAAREPEVGRAARDGELERLALEHGGAPAAVPRSEHLAHALAPPITAPPRPGTERRTSPSVGSASRRSFAARHWLTRP